jgi:Tetracyclin repressor-like, C-terminal domain
VPTRSVSASSRAASATARARCTATSRAERTSRRAWRRSRWPLLSKRLGEAAQADPVDALAPIGHAYLAFAADEPVRFRLLFVDQPSRRRSLAEQPSGTSPYQVVLRAARRAIDHGGVSSELDAESIS